MRRLDSEGKGFRRKQPHLWDDRDWVAFRWQAGADRETIESLLLESGKEFARSLRRPPRRGPKPGESERREAESPAESETAPIEETPESDASDGPPIV